jgi:hypothetical protein
VDWNGQPIVNYNDGPGSRTGYGQQIDVYGQQFNVPQRPQQIPNPFLGRPDGLMRGQQPMQGMMSGLADYMIYRGQQQPMPGPNGGGMGMPQWMQGQFGGQQQNQQPFYAPTSQVGGPYSQDPYAAIAQMFGLYGGGGFGGQQAYGGQQSYGMQTWDRPPQQQNYAGYTAPGYGDFVDRAQPYGNFMGSQQPQQAFGGQQMPQPSISSQFGTSGGASQAPAFNANDPWAGVKNRPQAYNSAWNLYGGGGQQQATNANSWQNWGR